MTDKERILNAWDRCNKCTFPSVFGDQKPYLDCEYTIGLYCGQDRLVRETVELLRTQPDIIECKDCKYGEPCKNGKGEDAVECFNSEVSLESRCRNPNWFCAEGEPKEVVANG